MSRSARMRANRRAVIPRTTPEPVHMPQHLIPVVAPGGYVGRRDRVSYAGSGDAGYRSTWARSPYYANAVTRDIRWSK